MTETVDTRVLFEMPVELELIKSIGGGKRIIRGYASTEAIDRDGEIILQNGIDFTPLLKSGFLNYDHQFKSMNGARLPIIVGYPTKAEVKNKGLWVECEMLKSDGNSSSEQLRLADELWEMGQAFQRSGGTRSLAYSVEGGVVQRRGSRIVKSVVRDLAITHKPVNPNATVELFAKSFFAACGSCNKRESCNLTECSIRSRELEKALSTTSAPEMLLENLDRGLTEQIYGNTNCNCYDRNTMQFAGGLNGAIEHLSKCRKLGKQQSINLMRSMIQQAPNKPEVAALIKTAGIVPQN